MVACAEERDAPAPVTATELVDARINTAVYECHPADRAAFELTIRRGAAELALWLPPAFDRPYLVLSEEYVGTRFTGVYREGDVTLDLADASVDLGVGDERFTDCRENRLRSVWEHAKLSGVNFRATGESPGWYLEIRDGDRLDFRSALDEAPLTLPMTAIQLETGAASASYRSSAAGSDLVAAISATPCTVADGLGLSGVTVVVTESGRRFSGCGRPLH
jgi:hypothetical protein